MWYIASSWFGWVAFAKIANAGFSQGSIVGPIL